MGYADGFLRCRVRRRCPAAISDRPAGRLRAAINGMRVPVLGKVTMDLTMFDVTDLGRRRRSPSGGWLELFGRDDLPRGGSARRGDESAMKC
jgi:alanine racemase